MISIRKRLEKEKTDLKASEEAKKMRFNKKFGKMVQKEKEKEKEKEKKRLEGKVGELKRSKQNSLPCKLWSMTPITTERKRNETSALDDKFDIEIEETLSEKPNKRSKGSDGSKMSRTARNNKFGRPKESRRPKENDRWSSNFAKGNGSKLQGGKRTVGKNAMGSRGGSGKTKRLGKSRRK
jgi:rRNA-processing protein EBP2